MSLSEISKSIADFFPNKDPIIFCLSGKWGVGKTFLFDKQLKEYNKKISDECLPNIKTQDNLLKISLFGLRSLDEIKHIIFQEIMPSKLLSKTLNITSSFIKNKIDLDLEKHLKSFLFDKNVNNLSLCFDDLERKSPSLKIIDFLGFVSMLKEKHQCKIFLILNDDMFQEEDKEDYNKYFEKVVDRHIKYISQSDDSFKIVCEKYHDKNQFDEDAKNLLKEKIKILNINNIRIIDKIFFQSNLLLGRLKKSIIPKVEKETIDNALIALCLFCDGIYSPPDSENIDKPKLEEVLNPENKIYNNDKQRFFLYKLGYYDTNEFYLEIHKFIVNGFFDSDFDNIAFKYNEKFKKGTKQNNYYEVWEVFFHGSFNDDGDEVVEKIYQTFIEEIEVMSPSNLEGVYQLLSDYDDDVDKRANGILELYFEKHKDNKENFNLNHFPFVRSPKIIEFCNESLKKIKQNNIPSIDVAVENYINPKNSSEGYDSLNNFSIDDFYNFFKESKIKNAEKIRISQNFDNAKYAIERIKDESKINKLRIDYRSK